MKNNFDKLIKTLTNIDNFDDMQLFMKDLCSEPELIAIGERLEVAQMLNDGKMYSEIAAKLNVSSSLIAKIDDVKSRGGGGFDKALKLEDKACQYHNFAQVYDALTYDVEYETRVNYVEKLIHKFSDIKTKSILDLACGTGTTTAMFADKGYEVIGIDSSEEMLAQAKSKQGKRDILYLCQQMRDFELYGTVDAVVCLLDSINYVIEEEDLLSCFKWVKNYLNPGGVFVFDINTRYKLEYVLAGNIFNDEKDNVFYSWENYYDDEENICEFDLNFFVKHGKDYRRFNEIHYERAYTDREIKTILKKSGLEFVASFDDLSENAPCKTSEKVFYIAKRGK